MSQFDEMVEFLDSAYAAKDVIVPCLVGPAGIGKTAAVKQHAINVGAKNVVTIIASQILPTEVSGMTMPDKETRTMDIYDHFRLGNLKNGDILFFDELLEADQMVLSACLTLIESRQMMSGRMLPDIQIIAATNPTIKPQMLKENIRQRFLFKTFGIDAEGCREYIKKQYGIDIGTLTVKLEVTGDKYNILSPRSMTKMVHWLNSAKNKKERYKISCEINSVWNSQIGTELFRAFEGSKENRIVHALRDSLDRCFDDARDQIESIDKNVADAIYDNFDNELTISDMMATLMKLPGWEELKEELESMPSEDDECDYITF